MQKLLLKIIASGLLLGLTNMSHGRMDKPGIKTIFVKDSIPPLNKSLALKPPMGWNSWDCFGFSVTEEEVKASANYMAKNLKKLGYEYIVVDMLWYGDKAASDFENFVHESTTRPNFSIDRNGRLLPDAVKFPSSKNGNGFKPLADYVHSLGLKFGVHMMRGIPWQAVDKNLLINGTAIGAKSIGLPNNGCEWYDGIYGVDMTKPGAQEYYNSVYALLAEWGVDFVKADDLTNTAELEAISKAIRLTGRDIVLSVVPTDDIPLDVLKENVHMARTGVDFWDVWEMLKKGYPVAAAAVKKSSPGYWPDLDMLPIGKLGLKISYKGPEARISRFNKNELHTLLTLWYISRMPLMIGGYLPQTDPLTKKLLANEEALQVNRNSTNNRQIKFKNAYIIWAADVPQSNDKYVAFFNQWESVQPIRPKITWQQLGLPGKTYRVRDLWANKELGEFKDAFSNPVSAHGAGLFKVYE